MYPYHESMNLYQQSMYPYQQSTVHVALPAVYLALQAVHVSWPAFHESLPAVHVALPAAQVSLPAAHVSLPGVHVSLPAVHLWSLVGTAPDDLWRSVEWTAAEGIQQVLPVEHVGEAKVGDLGATPLVQQDVLQLQVPVTDVVLQRKGSIRQCIS